MATERLVSAVAYGDRHDKPLSLVIHHDQGHAVDQYGGLDRGSRMPLKGY